MDPSQNGKKSLGPVFLGMLFVVFASLGIGILLPDAVRGYDVETLAEPPFETIVERGKEDLQAKELDLIRKADYVTWKAFGYVECAILDMGDLRLAIPRIRTRGSKTWFGRLKIQTSASQKEVDESKPYRVGGDLVWLETKWKGGANECNFTGLSFEIRDSRLHIAGKVFEFGKGRRILVVNREGKIEAGLRIASDGTLHPLISD